MNKKKLINFFICLTILLLPNASFANDIKTSDSISIFGKPKYKSGFSNFDYVNPNAPKGLRKEL